MIALDFLFFGTWAKNLFLSLCLRSIGDPTSKFRPTFSIWKHTLEYIQRFSEFDWRNH